MNRITVFCGSSSGTDAVFEKEARLVGQLLAQAKIELVYGGSKIGLMGIVADAAMAQGGQAIGVIPKFLKTKEVAHEGLTELILVDSMHQRKTMMNELCDGFIALPGGFGTFEELFEVLTWSQLGLHKKPIALLNTNGYYTPLIDMINTMVNKGFLKPINQQMLLVCNKVDELLPRMNNYSAPIVGKWICKEAV